MKPWSKVGTAPPQSPSGHQAGPCPGTQKDLTLQSQNSVNVLCNLQLPMGMNPERKQLQSRTRHLAQNMCLLSKPSTPPYTLTHQQKVSQEEEKPCQRGISLWPSSLPSFPDGSVEKNQSATQETQVTCLGGKDPLEKEMAAHSSILA